MEQVIIKIKAEHFFVNVDKDTTNDSIGKKRKEDADTQSSMTESQVTEMVVGGVIEQKEGRWVLSYEEEETAGMGKSTTELSFALETPGLISICRTGDVKTALIYEMGKRNHCLYETPFMPLDVCVYTTRIDNKLLSGDKRFLFLDYKIEIGGAKTEHCRMRLIVKKASTCGKECGV